MQYRTLGRTGIQVSPYALGTLMFATSMGNDPGDSARLIHRALDAGINFIDTADAYGDSEEVVGRALEGRRDDVVLATKFSRPTGQDPNQQGASRRWIVTAVENSLRRLRTDHIDLYQLHRPDPRTDIEETLGRADRPDPQRQGPRDRRLATPRPPTSSRPSGSPSGAVSPASTPSSRPTPSSTAASSARCCPPPSASAWAPWSGVRSARGLLTGRVRARPGNDLRRAGLFRHLNDERRLDVVEQLIPLAAEAGLPMTHLAMAFTIAHPGVTSALIGVRTTDHLDSLLSGLDVTLSDDLLDRIDEIVPPGTDVGVLDQAYQPPALSSRTCAAAPWPPAPRPDPAQRPRMT